MSTRVKQPWRSLQRPRSDLHSFKSRLKEHLLAENARRYGYRSHCLQGDVVGRELIGAMRPEKGDTGRLIMRFLKQRIGSDVTAENVAQFIVHPGNIAAPLADRAKREEQSLYTL